MSYDNDDFLGGGSSAPAVKFTNPGDTVKGTVTAVKKMEDRDLGTGQVKTWPNGDPKYVFVFTLNTDEGEASLWVRGNMVSAIREAAHTANVKQMVGTTLAVQFTGLGEAKKGFHAPKLFKAQIKPGSTVTADDLL